MISRVPPRYLGGAPSASGMSLRLISVHRDIGKDDGRVGLAGRACAAKGQALLHELARHEQISAGA